MALIELNEISKVYDMGRVQTMALNNVSLTIDKGEFVAIMGPSGSGKSTMMNIMGFLDVPDEGDYIFNGEKFTDFDENSLADIRNNEIGFVFQSFYLLPRMTAMENVRLPMIYAGIPSKKQQELASDALKSVNLLDRADHRPNEMSGGQQQRVAIARALTNTPKIIFADEPTGNLDSKSGKEVMSIFQKLNDEGATIILVTHDKPTAAYAHRVITLKDGEIISDERSKKKTTKKTKKNE